jgi:hypothetical protein
MQRRGPPSQLPGAAVLCCAVLCCICAAVLCAVQHPLHPSCTTRHCHVVVSGRSCVEGGGLGNLGALVLVVMMSWHLGAFSQQSVAGVQGLSRQVF